MALLETIDGPGDLKKVPIEQLPALAGEIRREIIEVISKNGGHLASSLGVVELSIALHYVFDSPTDRLIWDVGHQAYAHKILTGRRERFATIRQTGGISGFTSRGESPHDAFGTGHASTSVSAALGIAEGLRLAGGQGKVIAVIGDGSLTGGLAFEGLNSAGHLEKDLIVVLNDNEMSINPNVGALSAWFSRKFATESFNRFRRQVKDWLKNLPRGGGEAIMMIRRAIDSSKALFTPGMLFEGLNFQYVGPIDGHNTGELIEVLRGVRELDGPVLVHVHTQKGKGYVFAEEDPARFHGVNAFDVATGKSAAGGRTFTKAFGESLVSEAERRPEIVAITAAMTEGTGLSEFQKRFPERFYDVGIAEEHAVTFAAGLATTGVMPVVAIYSTFIQRGYDQIIHDVALQNLPVVFALDRAGIVGTDGPTHHGAFDLSFCRLIPGVTIMAPADEGDLANMLHSALHYGGPCFVRYPRAVVPDAEAGSSPVVLPRGRGAAVFGPNGRADVAVIAVGTMVLPAVAAARTLCREGVSAAVVDARFAKPLDEEMILDTVTGVRALLCVEENALAGGFGTAVLETLALRGALPPRFRRLGLPDRFIPHGDRAEVLRSLDLDETGIAEAVRRLLEEPKAAGLKIIGAR
ncbi:MAG: 1-deoxy-D-xylulose-5-phosphate synthase [Deltaproteobacteria bacterium]|nr:1-deoxy-D-xylulose-5-phosphate synthase [Deltaproteobacteria bacterium]